MSAARHNANGSAVRSASSSESRECTGMARLCRRSFKSWKACLLLCCYVLLGGASSLTVVVLLKNFSTYQNRARPTFVNLPNIQYAPGILYIIAGILADIRFGRYKVIAYSCVISFVLLLASSTVSLISIVSEDGQLGEGLLWVGIALYIGHFAIMACFRGTVLQFGLDQLPDASSDELSSFIHWYVWTKAIIAVPIYIQPPNNEVCITLLVISMVISVGMLILGISLHKGVCGCNIKFTCEPPSGSPYRNVLQVLRFAKNHTTPLQRSALTYWEADLPSRMDLGKDKYGGPFTNEQVEDVKTLFRLLRTLVCILLMNFVLTISLQEAFELHLGREQQISYSITPTGTIYVITGVFSSPGYIGILLIPLHELVLQPLLGNRYLPNMMTKIKMAAILLSASLVTNLIIDSVGHSRQNVQCMFSAYFGDKRPPGQLQAIYITPLVLILPALMTDLAIAILHTSILEFVISQAPYPMRGMTIGLFYFLTGVYALLGVGYDQIFRVPSLSSLPGCCSLYYTIGATICLSGTVLIFVATYRYKYRERSEVINEYQFVDNYYST